MWKKEDAKPQGVSDSPVAPVSSAPVSSNNPVSTPATPTAIPVLPRGAACISHGIKIKGEATGSEDLYVDGVVEGKLTARDKVLLGSTGQVTGEVQTDRLTIEDGALLRGKVDAGKQLSKVPEAKAAAATATSKSSDSMSMSSGTAAN